MNILWITNDINQVGGIEKVICGLSNYFVKEGHRVTIASVNSNKSDVFFALDKRVTVKHCGIDREHQTRKEFLYAVRDVLKESSDDVAIGCQESINFGMIIFKNKFSGKVIVSQHNTRDFFTTKRLILNCIFYRFADKLFLLTESDKRFYEKRFVRNCVVVPNAYHGEAASRSKLDEHVIINVARLSKVKQHDCLIRAFSKIHKDYPDWKLKIVGDGEELDNLLALVKQLELESSVIFSGFRSDVLQQMQKASMFVLSSWNEGFPLVILEAMVCGLPIIGFDIPSVREEVTEDGGLLVALNDEDALADAMKKLIEDTEMRKVYGEKAYKMSKKYSVEKIGERWIAEMKK